MKQHRYIAEHLWTRGDRQEAIRRSRVDVLPAARRLVERNRTADGTTDARAETDLAQALQSHGQYLHYAGSSSEAIGPLMESRQIWNRLATNAPDVVTHPRDNARTGYMLALALIKTDESNAAVELLLEIDDALSRRVRPVPTMLTFGRSAACAAHCPKRHDQPRPDALEIGMLHRMVVSSCPIKFSA